MDRLPSLGPRRLLALCVPALVGALACSDSTPSEAPAPNRRVVAVTGPKRAANASELCDVAQPADSAPTFSWPPLDATAPAARAGAYRWINLWATWCPPCIEELPLIARLARELNAEGVPMELSLLSVDQAPEDVRKFAENHPEARASLRLRDFSALEKWLVSVGLDAGATLPVHLFVDPAGKVRCARTGAVRESDAALIKQLVRGG
jgi:thiol-disulfide isomerase/thioredoxin